MKKRKGKLPIFGQWESQGSLESDAGAGGVSRNARGIQEFLDEIDLPGSMGSGASRYPERERVAGDGAGGSF